MSSLERLSRWPLGSFPIPTFSFDVELKLAEVNAEIQNTGKHLKLTRDQSMISWINFIVLSMASLLTKAANN